MTSNPTDAALVALYNRVFARLKKAGQRFDYTTVIATMAREMGVPYGDVEERLIDITARAAC